VFSRIAVKTNSIAHLGLSRFAELELPFPPLPEQRKIAEILRTWDEAIEKLEALRAAKLRRHRALTHSLVFGTRQLDRFRTTDEVTAHHWFTLPATWSSKPIGKLAREVSERNGDAEQHEVLSCSKYDGFVRSLEYFKKQVFSADLSGYKKIWRGDFGFPSNHVEEGSIGLQNLTDVGVVSPIYTVFRFAPEKVDADYAFAVLKTGLYRHIFEVSTSASVDRRGSLRWSEFSKLPFPVPSLAEQKAIAEVLRTAQIDLDALTTEIDALTRQKRGLMQKLLTGEWRVTADATSPSNLAEETTNAG
jgi:type I restriction enzyme S subunit